MDKKDRATVALVHKHLTAFEINKNEIRPNRIEEKERSQTEPRPPCLLSQSLQGSAHRWASLCFSVSSATQGTDISSVSFPPFPQSLLHSTYRHLCFDGVTARLFRNSLQPLPLHVFPNPHLRVSFLTVIMLKGPVLFLHSSNLVTLGNLFLYFRFYLLSTF
jgi:hypothetical protein